MIARVLLALTLGAALARWQAGKPGQPAAA